MEIWPHLLFLINDKNGFLALLIVSSRCALHTPSMEYRVMALHSFFPSWRYK